MSNIVLNCPMCHAAFRITQEMLGHDVACPSCRQPVTLPDADSLDAESGDIAPPKLNDPRSPIPSSLVPETPKPVTCVSCQGTFGVSKQMLGQRVACPICATEIEIAADGTVASGRSAALTHPIVSGPVEDSDARDSVTFVIRQDSDQSLVTSTRESTQPEIESADNNTAAKLKELEEATRMLPPSFELEDPGSLDFHTKENSAYKIQLPDSEGGTRTIDGRIVHVLHKGEMIELIALTPEQRRRRRYISNFVSILLAILMLWIAYKFLTM